MTLKTTPEERAMMRSLSLGGTMRDLLDDLDTIAAKVASLARLRDTALELADSYERGDEPEGAPSARRTVLAIAELLRNET